jgi:transcriptional regulator with XRE-family HTH domain
VVWLLVFDWLVPLQFAVAAHERAAYTFSGEHAPKVAYGNPQSGGGGTQIQCHGTAALAPPVGTTFIARNAHTETKIHFSCSSATKIIAYFAARVYARDVRRTQLSKREIQICHRLRKLRERVGITQAHCAGRIGIERSTLVNYELGKTPLRYEIALRFCRELIVSEEWLATGRFDACRSAAIRHGLKRESNLANLDFIFFRQCVDLLSEPASLHVAPGTLFSEAYDRILAPKYQQLVDEFFYHPRICFTDSDSPELGLEWLNVINTRYLSMVRNEAIRKGESPARAWRVFMRNLFELCDMAFRKSMGFNLAEGTKEALTWLQSPAGDPAHPASHPEGGTSAGGDSKPSEKENTLPA